MAAQPDRDIQHLRDAARDGEAQPQPLPARLRPAPELLEDEGALAFFDPRPGVVHLDAHPAGGPAHADQHPPCRGMAKRVGEEILQDAAEQTRVTTHPDAGRYVTERQPLLHGHRPSFGNQRVQHLRQGEFAYLGDQAAGFQP